MIFLDLIKKYHIKRNENYKKLYENIRFVIF